MSKPIKIIAVVSDLHSGSTMGLLPPEFEIDVDDQMQPVPQNAVQQWLWQCWTEAIKWLKQQVGNDRLALVVNGDAIEGLHHGGGQVWSRKTDHHVEAAHHALMPLAELADRLYLVRGTECHVGTSEHKLGCLLAAEKDAASGLRAWDHLPIEVNGTLNSFRHHCSATSRAWLESGEMSRALSNERQEALDAGWPVPNVLHRAHRHRFGSFTNGISLITVSGPWQMGTRFVHKALPGSITRPSIYIHDYRGLSRGELPRVEHLRFRPPAPKGVSL